MALATLGCRTVAPAKVDEPFSFAEDTLDYANELVWEYSRDPETGKLSHSRRDVVPDYTLRCFVMARSVAQFYSYARFDAEGEKLNEGDYRSRIAEVVDGSLRRLDEELVPITFPGYANLREFSREWGWLLKEECGAAWQSYFQRGHWRVPFPFTRRHQQRIADQLTEWVRSNHPAVVHAIRFPSLSINHSMVVYGIEETDTEIHFDVFDPNTPEKPSRLSFSRELRRFFYPPNINFEGGRVDLYQIYHKWNY